MKMTKEDNLTEKYSKGTIFIHWISFLLIVLLIPTGFLMSDMEPSTTKLTLLRVHVFVGALVFVLTLLRIWFFFKDKRPSKLNIGSPLHNKLVVYIENSFYYILVLLCLSGIAIIITNNMGVVIKNGDISIFTDQLNNHPVIAHRVLAILLIILLCGHIFGVISYYIKTKRNTLKRILP